MELATALAANPTPICTTSEGGLIGTITEWLITLMETIGGIGVALAIAPGSVVASDRKSTRLNASHASTS